MFTYTVDNSTSLVLREQDEAARRAQKQATCLHRNTNGSTVCPECGITTEEVNAAFERYKAKQAPVFVPPVGARVRIDWMPNHQDHIGEIVTVVAAELSACGTYILLTSGPDNTRVVFSRGWCRVSPLPASAIEVECPYVTDSSQSDPCRGVVGHACTYEGSDEERIPHIARLALFASLTGKKDSAPGSVGADKRQGDPKASPANGAPLGAEMGTAESADSVGTDRAAGSDSRPGQPVVSQPAAPSGFKPPKDAPISIQALAVECQCCGAPVGQHCYEERGKPLTINNGSHALRLAAFEARRERPEAPKAGPMPPRQLVPYRAAERDTPWPLTDRARRAAVIRQEMSRPYERLTPLVIPPHPGDG